MMPVTINVLANLPHREGQVLRQVLLLSAVIDLSSRGAKEQAL
jgi:hypothetical protein